MALLIGGLLLWSAVHLVPTAGASFRARVVASRGEALYLGGFSVSILLSLVLIVLGWQSAVPSHWYLLTGPVRHVAMLLVLIAFVLLVAAQLPTRIRRLVRHPQLVGVIVWAVAHLLLNGDSRSVVLFGALALWAALEIALINRRDGAWVKPEAPPWSRELLVAVLGLGLYGLFAFLHPYFTGMPVA